MGDFSGLSVALFFGFYYYVFNFNTNPGHEISNYKHKHYGKRGTEHRRQNLTSELRFRLKFGPGSTGLLSVWPETSHLTFYNSVFISTEARSFHSVLHNLR